jgi:hypothetical protein
MITRNNNPQIWKATSSINPTLLQYFVERVAEEGGHSLIVDREYINVHDVMQSKALADEAVLNARALHAMADIPSKCSPFSAESAAFTAGLLYRIYIRNLNLTENPFGVPQLLSSHPVLVAEFERGFANNPFDDRDYN